MDDVPSTHSSEKSKSCESLEDRHSTQHNDSDGFEFINYDGNSSNNGTKNSSWFQPVTVGSKRLVGQNISRIQITNLSTHEMNDDPSSSINKISMTPLVMDDGGDGTSVGEVLSTTSSINSATRNITNDNASVSIDHLIGHIEGSRPLLEDDDDGDEENSSNPTDSSYVKPFIEIDQEIEFVPLSTSNSTVINLTDEPVNMFSSMTSSINSVVMMYPSTDSNYRPAQPPKDLLTEDPPSLSTDFETLSLQQIVDENEENQKLDEEVAQSLNCQVILDQLTNKDLFGSVPFNDKELIVSGL